VKRAGDGLRRGAASEKWAGSPLLTVTGVLAAAVLATAGCGGGGDTPRLTVSAASSLKAPFTDYAARFDSATVRLSFAGSDQLAAQIRAGARPDVLAAADEALPAALHREGLVERPATFARNRLVVAVPRDGGRVREFEELADSEIRIAAGSPSVPAGSYMRRALAQLPLPERQGIEDNIVSHEPDAASVIGRVRGGAVDAGFVYATDVAAVDELRAIELPVPVEVAYSAAVVRASEHPEEARRFVRGLVAGDGRRALERAGFR
jgi:molybdate transport system substrate-binding protein